jgi:hypothetical protein
VTEEHGEGGGAVRERMRRASVLAWPTYVMMVRVMPIGVCTLKLIMYLLHYIHGTAAALR